MVRITFIEHNGTPHLVETPTGTTLKDAALNNGVPGIDGDCGGNCACATCHVFIDPRWWNLIGSAQTQNERDMLGFADGASETSRLGCQVTVSPELDGLVVHLPLGQH